VKRLLLLFSTAAFVWAGGAGLDEARKLYQISEFDKSLQVLHVNASPGQASADRDQGLARNLKSTPPRVSSRRRTSNPATGRGTAAGNVQATPTAASQAWKREDWNTVRIRVQGDAPHATVWINGQQISDATDSANHALDGMIEGPIAIQIHGGDVRWQPGGFWRWRNLAIKELPR
jgi:hypothetical protein